jgi:hypothetical protein
MENKNKASNSQTARVATVRHREIPTTKFDMLVTTT